MLRPAAYRTQKLGRNKEAYIRERIYLGYRIRARNPPEQRDIYRDSDSEPERDLSPAS
jgi:hypothetical protein